MTIKNKTIQICDCNLSMPLDGAALSTALELGQPLTVHHQLCRRELSAFEGAAKGDQDMIVGCTQEAPLFEAMGAEAKTSARISFVNLRETAGWSQEASQSTAKIAALLAAAALPEPDPVPVVNYTSGGALLIIGRAGVALAWAERLAQQLEVTVLINDADANVSGDELPSTRRYPVVSGKLTRLDGYLGAFEAAWEQVNPIDLDVCTRCNACVKACPENAIDYTYQIDMDKCRDHRKCVAACGAIGAIDFDRTDTKRSGRFDLVLDLSRQPAIRIPQLPQGYFAPGNDVLAQAQAAFDLAQLVGEFEKPKYFVYQKSICAHSRSQVQGCNKCIDVCSTQAISADGNYVKVEPHLCMGCGGCATVCPSGAMGYAYPRVADSGLRAKTLLATYRRAGGERACLLFHNATDGRDLLMRSGRHAGGSGATTGAGGGKGLPARVLPLETFSTASIGMESLLGAFAQGANQVVVLTGERTHYADASRTQMGFAEEILQGLGYSGTHFYLLETDETAAMEAALWGLPPAVGVTTPATFNLSNEKRKTLEFIFDHLAKHAPAPQEHVALGHGAPFGEIVVNAQTCTLCLACVGACPENALHDSKELPQLRFTEKNCVQCGLCENTCPEKAISLVPRLLFGKAAGEPRVLNETQPFHCVRCHKAFSTMQMVESMIGKLSTHSMFGDEAALNRLRMCGDCRVIDLMKTEKSVRISDV